MRNLIIGSEGQDGTYLARQASEDGQAVFKLDRKGLTDAEGTFQPHEGIKDAAAMARLIAEIKPERIFYLAAHHHSSEEADAADTETLRQSLEVNTIGLLNLLEAVSAHAPKGRVFYAASSRVFGHPASAPQNETTPFNPVCAYGLSKEAGVRICRLFRARNNIFCSVGILYNHESPLREAKFLSRKLAQAAVAIERGAKEPLVLGNLDAEVDWGYAPEFTDAMRRILDLDQPDDFVIATGKLNTVQLFAQAVFEYVGLNWQDHVQEEPSVIGGKRTGPPLVGDTSHLKALSGWQAETDIRGLARLMVDAERQRGGET
jgi:GDPmannose 4,6-dehydratase